MPTFSLKCPQSMHIFILRSYIYKMIMQIYMGMIDHDDNDQALNFVPDEAS